MKTKSLLKMVTACIMTVIMALASMSTVSASANARNFANLQDIAVSLQGIGLSLYVADMHQRLELSQTENDVVPHIGRISYDESIRIFTTADVDLLLAFARAVYVQGLSGFSWDTCIDIALAEAGLEEYWRAGFRQITQSSREQLLVDLAANYTFDELSRMGVFYRYGMINTVHDLELFQRELSESNALRYVPIAPFSHFGTIWSMTLRDNAWRSSFRVFVGDSVSYSVQYRRVTTYHPALMTSFSTGTGLVTGGGFINAPSWGWYTVAYHYNFMSRTFHITRLRGIEVFGIVPGGGNSFTISGSYQVTW